MTSLLSKIINKNDIFNHEAKNHFTNMTFEVTELMKENKAVLLFL